MGWAQLPFHHSCSLTRAVCSYDWFLLAALPVRNFLRLCLLTAMLGLCQCARASQCRAPALGSQASVVVAVVAAHGLSSYGAQAELPQGMWDLSSPTKD